MRVLSTMLVAGIVPLLIAAQAPNGDAPSQPAAKVSIIDKVVCKKFPPPTGTRVRARTICKTQVEWNLIRHEEQDALERVQGRNAGKNGA